jgi:hypothetical protein
MNGLQVIHCITLDLKVKRSLWAEQAALGLLQPGEWDADDTEVDPRGIGAVPIRLTRLIRVPKGF